MDNKTYAFTAIAVDIKLYGTTGFIKEFGSTVNADFTLSDFSDHINRKLGARVHDDHPY